MDNIEAVLARLEGILDWATANQSPTGYFAAVYHHMTAAVRDAVAAGQFENNARMEQLDVLFAQRYFEAFDAWRAGQPCTQSWQLAFDAAADPKASAMQHILLGINAHINLDLGIAAARVRPQDAIYALRADFDRINGIIASLVDDMQQRLADVWLPFGWLDFLLKTNDEGWINFSIHVARGAAWQSAVALAFATPLEAEKQLIRNLDHGVALLGEKIRRPGWLIGMGNALMRRCERGSVSEKIALLRQK
jgi:hypothetical protein